MYNTDMKILEPSNNQEIRIIKQIKKSDESIINIYENGTVKIYDGLHKSEKWLDNVEEANKLFEIAKKENMVLFRRKGNSRKHCTISK